MEFDKSKRSKDNKEGGEFCCCFFFTRKLINTKLDGGTNKEPGEDEEAPGEMIHKVFLKRSHIRQIFFEI